MGKLRVTVFNTQPPHLFHGGVERRILEVAKRISCRANTVIYSGMKAGFRTATRVNGTVIVPCFSTDWLFPMDNWLFNRTVAKMLDLINADVYEAHTVSGYGFLKALRKRKIAKPFIQTIHGVLADEYLRYMENETLTPRMRISKHFLWYLAKIEKEAAEKATLIVTVSHYSQKRITQLYHVERDKIKVVPNGVDPQRFKPMKVSENFRAKLGIKGKNCILFVGNLVPRKGLNLLIEAAKNVVKENKDAYFLIAGDGPLKNSLIAYARNLNVLGNLKFFGMVSDEMLLKIYNCSDIVVLPSLQEGQGITLLEAQATAKPVVACKAGGTSEIVIHGETGLLVNPNSRELADALLTLLSDEDVRRRMGEKGRKFVSKNFSWDICARKMLKVYLEASSLA
ncbi:glycosyltransferase family 4 protein [Candidatus Bathyarchaeota archaeon]|nr:glycosyltransferase family 4 protein [Candidatus Bathyarchaeota archaeon]